MNTMHKTKIDISENKRVEVIKLLNVTLASTTDLYVQLKHAHWNVKGPEFIALHKLFDELAALMEEQVDIVAERITSLGGTALGTMQSAVQNTALNAYPLDVFSARDHLEKLTDNFAILCALSRRNIKDAESLDDLATGDMYIALTRMCDKSLWFLEAHLQK